MDFSGYGIKWRTSFKDLNEQTIVVDIYEDGWSSDPIILTDGQDPLETEWDDTQDIMTPLRMGSGNLRVINEGNLDGLMPTNTFQHLVKVSVGGIREVTARFNVQGIPGTDGYCSSCNPCCARI